MELRRAVHDAQLTIHLANARQDAKAQLADLAKDPNLMPEVRKAALKKWMDLSLPEKQK